MSAHSTQEMNLFNAPSADEQSDLWEIKSIMEVFKIVFKTFTECQPQLPIHHIEVDEGQEFEPPVYTMTASHGDFGNADRLTTGLLALPEGTSQQLRDACMNMLLCDAAMAIFLEPVSRKLHDLGARVKWHVVYPRPELLVQYMFHDVDLTRRTLHSVMGITLSNGEKYVADFTNAQYGYDPAHWFMRQDLYMVRYTNGEMLEWTEDDDEYTCRAMEGETWQMPSTYEGKRWIPKVREVASNIDWATLADLTYLQRIETVQAQAREAFEAFRSSGAWRVDPPSSL